jgi:hypothetical protein
MDRSMPGLAHLYHYLDRLTRTTHATSHSSDLNAAHSPSDQASVAVLSDCFS